MENLTEIERLEVDSPSRKTIVVRFPIVHASLAFIGMPWNPLFPGNQEKEEEFQIRFRNILYAASHIHKQMMLLVIYYVNKTCPDDITYEMSLIDIDTAGKLPLGSLISMVVEAPISTTTGEISH